MVFATCCRKAWIICIKRNQQKNIAKNLTIVTFNSEETILEGNLTIEVVPAWKWILRSSGWQHVKLGFNPGKLISSSKFLKSTKIKNPAIKKALQASHLLGFYPAESEGFEPSFQFTPENGFRDRRVRPLCQLSETAAKIYKLTKRPTFFSN